MARIAITGATGELGSRVLRALHGGQHALTAVVRDPSRLPDLPGVDVAAVSGFGDGEQMAAAVEGADALFLVSAHEHPDRVGLHRTAVAAAARAGVGRVVYTSFIGAAPDAIFTLGRDHHATEEAIRTSGMRFTFLRDNLYQSVAPLLAGEDGVIRGPAEEGTVRWVAHQDIADAAARVLADGAGETHSPHDGRAYDMSGPEALTLDQTAAVVSRVTGREIRFENETVEEAYASRAHYGVDQYQLDAWVSTYTAIAAGEMATPSDHLEGLIGRAPTTLEQTLSQ